MTAKRIPVQGFRVPTTDTRRVKPQVRVTRGIRQPGENDHIYRSAAWKSLMTKTIKQRGRRCEDPACTSLDYAAGKRLYGHHRVSLSEGGLPYDPDNVELLCAACHQNRHAEERRQREAAGTEPSERRFASPIRRKPPEDEGGGGWGVL